MDRNTITGLVIIFAILVGYSIWMTPSQEEREAARRKQDSLFLVQRVQDSIALTRQAEARKRDSIAETQRAAAPEPQEENVLTTGSVNRHKLGVFANSSAGNDDVYYLENDLVQIGIAARGGKVISIMLKEYQTYDSLPLYLFDSEKTNFGITFFAANRLINTNELYFQPAGQQEMNITGEQTGQFSMRL